MAVVKSQETEEPSFSTYECLHYHVFLSFRGSDTRYTFIDRLYTELVRGGYGVFRDNEEISSGENIRSQLHKAIRESKISIVVFSKDYASSRWCLDELLTILKRHKQVGHRVLPVFYHVDPSDVRKQRGGFAESFVRHEEVFNKDRVKRWRAALRIIAGLKGVCVVKDRYEFEFIQDVVRVVADHVRLKVLDVAPVLVGRNSEVELINSWLRDGTDNVGIATIYGIGGIGKTAIAREVYNMNINEFEGSSFLEDVRQMSKQHGLACLQTKLVKDLGRKATDSNHGVAEGLAMIRHVVRHKRVLLVLDDVDDLDQFDGLIGKKEWFCPGSKIIITTKMKSIPRAHEQRKVFEIKELDDDQSLELLCWHAFGQDHPLHGYEKCSKDLVHHCRGLPLALQVLGSSLSGTSTDVWESELKKLEANPNHKIQDVLKINYDSLPDYHDKKLFLDIACFYIGVDKNYAVKILDGCGFFTASGIRNLMDRCLVTISDENKLMMHQLIRDMGRELVRQESFDNPGKRSRVWDNEDAVSVLTKNTGTESIRGLSLNLPIGNTNSTEVDKESCSKRRRLDFSFWISVNNSSKVSFSTKAFARMQNLQLLNLSNVRLTGCYNYMPRSLVWLRWYGFSSSYIPNDFAFKKLAVLEMPSSELRYLWKGTRLLEQLKVLDLRHSQLLVSTPNFRGLPVLEILVLEGCINLVEIDESIGDLRHLESLNLKDCISLCLKLPVLKSLKELDVSGCSGLEELHGVLSKFEALKVLNANGLVIKDFNAAKLSWWQSTLWFLQLPRRWARSNCLPFDSFPRSLIELSLEDCGLSDSSIPKDLSFLSSLKILNLSGNPITHVPQGINHLNLSSLWLNRCTKLQSVSVPPKTRSGVQKSTPLKTYGTDQDIRPYCLGLALAYCEKLVEIEYLFKVEPLENIDREVVKHLGLSNMEKSLKTTEVLLDNRITFSATRAAIQVSRERGMHSVFLPGKDIPDWFSYRVEGNSILFCLSPVAGLRLEGFSLCMNYRLRCQRRQEHPGKLFSVVISNRTTGKKWVYDPVIRGIPTLNLNEDVLWLSYWTLGDLGHQIPLGEGDLVEISGVMSDLDVKNCGIRLIYKEEQSQNNRVLIQGSFPWHCLATQLRRSGYCNRTHQRFLTQVFLADHIHAFNKAREAGEYYAYGCGCECCWDSCN